MKTYIHLMLRSTCYALVLALLPTLNLQLASAFAQGTAFTYQGQLNAGGSPASGSYNLTFTLFNTNASGVAIAGPVTNNAVGVTNGLFIVPVDFGPGAFTGASNWLEIAVATNGASNFTTLTPRQQLTPTPDAIYAESASGLSGTFSASQLTSIGNTGVGSYNFFVGSSGNSATSGSANTANGAGALQNNMNGAGNTANGAWTLLNNTSGSGNTADGSVALNNNTSGSNNTANGVSALYANTTGSANTANGAWALLTNTNGSANTADGAGALESNTNGLNNTAIGAWALLNSTTGSGNIALGNAAGIQVTTGSYNIHIGNQGSPNDNNIIRIGSGQSQTFIAGVINGNGGGLTNLSGAQLPAGALTNNQTGVTLSGAFTGDGSGLANLSVSAASLTGTILLAQLPATVITNGASGVNISGNISGNGGGLTDLNASQLTSIGNIGITTGSYANFFVGNSGNSTMIGSGNTAIGSVAFFLNTSGSDNTASGYGALCYNTSGSNNTANGFEALSDNTSGSYNTANGANALELNINGLNNTADGSAALFLNASGSNNIAIGYLAGYFITGSSNIDIGNQGSLLGDNNIIRIGTSQTATFIAGISGTTAASGVAVYVDANGQLGTLTSSRRFKKDIQTMGQSSDVLYALQPVTFKYKPGIDPQGIPQFGLVAEDVEKVAPDLVAHDGEGKPYTVRYEAVNAMLLNEFLKQHKTVESQNAEIQNLERKLDELGAVVKQFAAQK